MSIFVGFSETEIVFHLYHFAVALLGFPKHNMIMHAILYAKNKYIRYAQVMLHVLTNLIPRPSPACAM